MEIRLTYRKTRRLSMRIAKNGDALVSAPIGCPRKEVTAFIASNRSWMEKARTRKMESERKRMEFFGRLPLSTKAQRQEAIQRLDSIVRPMVDQHSRRLGVCPQSIGYKATISRWGCCTPRSGQVCFSIYLLLLPEWCIEHVVVHELAHLVEPSHNERFHQLMDRFFPHWKEARKETIRLSRSGSQD